MGFMRGEGGSGGGGGGVPTLTASRAVVTNGSGALAAATTTAAEVGYLNGVTSAIQTQLNAKAPLASPTLTGTPAAPTAAADTNTTQIATTAMVQAAIANAVVGLLELKGSTDASANPNYPAASKGDAYTISVAGKVGGASGKTVEVGDVIVATADNAGGAEASVGTSWTVWQANLVGALLGSNNLSDLVSAETARNNLGLGAADVVTFEKLIARQDGGVAGTDDVEVYHDGTRGVIVAKSGYIALRNVGDTYDAVRLMGSGAGGIDIDGNAGNIRVYRDAYATPGAYLTPTGLLVGNDGQITFYSGNVGSTVDTGLARTAAGELETNTGTAGVIAAHRSFRKQNAQTGTTYTLVLTDGGRFVSLNNASAVTVTVPPNASVAFPTGTEIDLAQLGAGTVTVAAGSGVTIRSKGGLLSLGGQYAGATLKKLDTNEWLLVGDLA